MGYQKCNTTVCRLCSCTEQIVDVFHSLLDNASQLRFSILLATGIHIKQSDIVSKMVCHRCCEIALKSHKYRNTAVANDKLLKERCGQPYTPPLTDLDEILRVASETVNQQCNAVNGDIIVVEDDSDDPLELLNLTFKQEPSTTDSGTRDQPDVDASLEPTDISVGGYLSDHSPHSVSLTTTEISTTTERTAVAEDVNISDKLVSPSAIDVAHRQSIVASSFQNNKRSAVSLNSCKRICKVRYKHPSVRELFNTYKGITLPQKIFNSDVSPVISLDSAEVNDWYRKRLKRKLPSVVIKKVPNSSNYRISSSSPLASSEHTTVILPNQSTITSSEHTSVISPKQTVVTSSENSTVPSSDHDVPISLFNKHKHQHKHKHKLKRNHEQINDAGDSDSDSINREDIFNYDHQKENDVPEANVVSSNVLYSENIQGSIPSKDNVTSHNLLNQQMAPSRKNVNAYSIRRTKKKSKGRCRTKRKKMFMDDTDVNEIIPEKKKRVYCNKNALKILNKIDLPDVSPSDKNEQKAIFTSSLELRPVKSPSTSVPTCVEPVPSVEPVPTAPLPSVEPVSTAPLPSADLATVGPLPSVELASVDSLLSVEPLLSLDSIEPPSELITLTTQKIFMCSVCNKIHDTKKELLKHESTHLKCKFCSKLIENVELLKKHQNESCFAAIISNTPCIKLKKVDSVPSIVEKYSEAFEEPNLEKQTECDVELPSNEYIDYSELHPHIEEIVLPTPPDDLFIGREETDRNFGRVEQRDINEMTTVTESSIQTEVVCVSDDSDDEIECVEISRHKIVNNPYFNSITEVAASSSTEKSKNATVSMPSEEATSNTTELDKGVDKSKCNAKFPPISNLGENEMLRYLFKKHSYSPSKCERNSQTFAASNSSVSSSSSPRPESKIIITVDRMFSELHVYKIPILLESQSDIGVTFKESIAEQRHPPTLECWAHKKYINILNKTSETAGTINQLANCNELLIKKKLTESNVVTTAALANNFCNISPISTTVVFGNDANQQRNSAVVKSLHSLKNQQNKSKVSVACTSNVTTSENNSVNSASPVVTCAVPGTSAFENANLQQFSSLVQTVQPRNTAAISNKVFSGKTVNILTTATGRQKDNINSTVENVCTKAATTSKSNTLNVVPSTIPLTSVNNLCNIVSTPTISYGGTYQQQYNNFLPIKPKPAPVPYQTPAITQNNLPVPLGSNQNQCKKSAVVENASSAIPFTVPISPTNNLCNITPIPAVMACKNPHSISYTDFMQGAVATTANIAFSNNNVVPYTMPSITANNVYGATPTPAMMKYSNAQQQQPTSYLHIMEPATSAVVSYPPTVSQPNQVFQINNNLTNMNIVTVNSNNVQLPLQSANTTYEQSQLYSASSNPSLLQATPNHTKQVSFRKQRLSLGIRKPNILPAQNCNNIRVKPIRELS